MYESAPLLLYLCRLAIADLVAPLDGITAEIPVGKCRVGTHYTLGGGYRLGPHGSVVTVRPVHHLTHAHAFLEGVRKNACLCVMLYGT